jgi:hypothetical protein
MTLAEKKAAFTLVAAQVRHIEARSEHDRIQAQARAEVAARYAELEQQRKEARATGGFSYLA